MMTVESTVVAVVEQVPSSSSSPSNTLILGPAATPPAVISTEDAVIKCLEMICALQEQVQILVEQKSRQDARIHLLESHVRKLLPAKQRKQWYKLLEQEEEEVDEELDEEEEMDEEKFEEDAEGGDNHMHDEDDIQEEHDEDDDTSIFDEALTVILSDRHSTKRRSFASEV